MSLFMRDSLGRLVPVNPGLPPYSRGNQGGMGRRLSEAELMTTLPDADLAGAIGPGVVPGGEQSMGARRLKLEQVEAANPPAPTFRPLGGAQQNNRGNARIVPLHFDVAGTSGFVVPSIVETPKNCGDDAEVLGVQLSLELPGSFDDPAGAHFGTDLNITAIIEWGVGGAIFSAECDWNQGISFSICASYLRISARIGDLAPSFGPDTNIVLKASIGYGDASSMNVSSPARFTQTIGAAPGGLGPGLAETIAIPPWAVGFTIVDGGVAGGGVPSPAPDYSVQCFLGADSLAEYRVTSRANVANQVEGQFPIPSGCRLLTVTNNLLAATTGTQVIFNLAF